MDDRNLNPSVDLASSDVRVPKRILTSLINSLSAGIVPRAGAPYIAIGRTAELGALLDALDDVGCGGGTMKFLVGRYGSGKSFLIQLLRGYALDRGFICADADLSPERRFCGGGDCGIATYRELMRNLASKASPDGGALPVILSRHYSAMSRKLEDEGLTPGSDEFAARMAREAEANFSALEDCVGGFDFARVLGEYCAAAARDDSAKKSACLRWLRGEFPNKTEARREMGIHVGGVIDDDNWYDAIKLWANLAEKIGYRGFIVFIDECVNIFKIPNRLSRESNYEKILSIFNDTIGGRAPNLGVILGGTPAFLEDTRRGLFSYEALRSRLSDSRFSDSERLDPLAPVIRLRVLSPNELLALLARLTKLYAMRYDIAEPLDGDHMERFLAAALARAGAPEMITPRELIRDYLALLGNVSVGGIEAFDRMLADGAPIGETNEERDDSRDPFALPDLDF